MEKIKNKEIYLMIIVAYLFSLIVRYIYIYQIGDNPEFIWNNSYIINTNDGYYFGSGVQKVLYGMHQYNPLVPDLFDRGLTFLTTILVKVLPFSLETIMFYLPAFISSLIVVPIILIGYLYKEPLWGFLSSLIIAIAWSYYNRTMLGYYDTDMFSIMILMWIVYFLLKSIKSNSLDVAFIGALLIAIYPFFYQPGRVVLYAIILFYSAYLLWDKKADSNSLKSVSLVLISAIPLEFLPTPWKYIVVIVALVVFYTLFKRVQFSKKALITIASISFLFLLIEGDIFGAIINKIITYIHTGVDSTGLKFFGVFQTIAEANGIPFFASAPANSVANRTIGSSVAFIIAIIGYIYLVYKRREFIILLPLVGIGLFSHWGGLRFTIYGSPALILGFVYLLIALSKEFIEKKKLQIASVVALVAIVLATNIYHAIDYNRAITPVFKKSEIAQLDKLKKLSNPKDYTLSWWDYGYPIWFYTNTNTLIDGGKHRHDNFVISHILLSTSPIAASNLARVAVERYVKANESYKEWKEKGENKDSIPSEFKFINNDTKEPYHIGSSPYAPAINMLLKNNQPNQLDPNKFLEELNSKDFKLPPKTRDIYLYMPTKSVRIFPVIAQFSNINLLTGKKLREVIFYSGYIRGINNSTISLSNGIRVDTKSGAINLSKGLRVNKLIVATHKRDGNIALNVFSYNPNSHINFLYLKSLGMGIVLDNATLNSNYVKMFLLGLYNKDIFELVDASVYGRVYKFKR